MEIIYVENCSGLAGVRVSSMDTALHLSEQVLSAPQCTLTVSLKTEGPAKIDVSGICSPR